MILDICISQAIHLQGRLLDRCPIREHILRTSIPDLSHYWLPDSALYVCLHPVAPPTRVTTTPPCPVVPIPKERAQMRLPNPVVRMTSSTSVLQTYVVFQGYAPQGYLLSLQIPQDTTWKDVRDFLLPGIPIKLHKHLERVEVVRKGGFALKGWVRLRSHNVFEMAKRMLPAKCNS
jgi:hypothetical protein